MPEEHSRYSRHIFLPEIGEQGQEKLLSAKVLIIGMGGLGSAAAYYLTASGIGTLFISDNELVELSNLQRQILYRTEDIGSLKTQAAQKNLLALNPHVSIIPLPGLSATGANLQSAVEGCDVILDCSDNFPTRYAVNALCVKYRKPLVSGSAIGWQGQVAVLPLSSTGIACYACLYPQQDITDEHQPRCADTGVLSPLVGVIGSMQAAETVKLILNLLDSNLSYLIYVDTLQHKMKLYVINQDSQCHCCN